MSIAIMARHHQPPPTFGNDMHSPTNHLLISPSVNVHPLCSHLQQCLLDYYLEVFVVVLNRCVVHRYMRSHSLTQCLSWLLDCLLFSIHDKEEHCSGSLSDSLCLFRVFQINAAAVSWHLRECVQNWVSVCVLGVCVYEEHRRHGVEKRMAVGWFGGGKKCLVELD